MVSDTSSIFMVLQTPMRPVAAGLLPLFLQPQNATWPDSSALNSTGAKPLPLCDPSQNGWLPLLPQAHHQYDLPASTSIR